MVVNGSLRTYSRIQSSDILKRGRTYWLGVYGGESDKRIGLRPDVDCRSVDY